MEKITIHIDGVQGDLKEISAGLKDVNKQLGITDDKAQETEKSFSALGAGIAAGIGFALVEGTKAAFSFAAGIGKAQTEMKVFARQMGVNRDEVKGMGFAVESVGLNLENFADISKDVGDKLGDFITTGAGPFNDLKDVLKLNDQEAQNLAQSLSKMSSEDRFKTIVTRLEEAGASGDQMTFVLESLGNEASRLAPLFSEGGKEFDRLTNKFDKVDFKLSDKEIAEFKEVSSSFSLIGEAIESITTKIIVMLGPSLKGFINTVLEGFMFIREHTDQVKKAFSPLVGIFKEAYDIWADLGAVIFETSESFNFFESALQGVYNFFQLLAPVQRVFVGLLKTVSTTIKDLFSLFDGAKTDSLMSWIETFGKVVVGVFTTLGSYVGGLVTEVGLLIKALVLVGKGDFTGAKNAFLGAMESKGNFQRHVDKGMAAADAFNFDFDKLDFDKKEKEESKKTEAAGGGVGTTSVQTSQATQSTAGAKVEGKQQRIINIDIESVIGKQEINSTTVNDQSAVRSMTEEVAKGISLILNEANRVALT